MKAAILTRSASFHTQRPLSNLLIGSPTGSEPLRHTRRISISSRSATHIEVKMSADAAEPAGSLRRARSDSDLILSDRPTQIWTPPARLPEEEEEIEICGGGRGKAVKIGGGGGDESESKRMERYYEEKLRSDPSNPLLLTNYGRFLHQEGEMKRAEEMYGRAILASPGDGDVLSLYGKLVWETHRDEDRAEGYFERAVKASPDDCYVLGSYASFLWEAEEEEDEEEGTAAAPLVEAF